LSLNEKVPIYKSCKLELFEQEVETVIMINGKLFENLDILNDDNGDEFLLEKIENT
jgi:hypothetical protein